MEPDPSLARLRFDRFELDEADARLTCAGEPVALAPKPFAVLCTLARSPRRLVTKNALLDAVWGHRFVAESVLKSAISEVRAALGDDPKQPRYLRRYRAAGIASSPRRWACPRIARLPSSAMARAEPAIPPWQRSRHCAAAMPWSPTSSARSPPRWKANGLSSTIPAWSPSHEALRTKAKRSASPAHRDNRRPARARAIQAPADVVGLLAAARPRGRGLGSSLCRAAALGGAYTRK